MIQRKTCGELLLLEKKNLKKVRVILVILIYHRIIHILSFSAEELPILEGVQEPFTSGTYIKLYEYDIGGQSLQYSHYI